MVSVNGKAISRFLLLVLALCAHTPGYAAEASAEPDVNPASSSTADMMGPVEEKDRAERYRIRKVENPNNPCDRSSDAYDYTRSWYDDTQMYINSTLCEPAVWFDSFFASQRVFDEGYPGTYVRWRNEFSLDEEERFKFKTGISFSAELPALKNRLRLTFESDDEQDIRDIVPDGGSNNQNNLGLALDVKQNARSNFNVSVTLKPRIRFRYRYTYPVYDTLTLRLTQEVQNEKGVNGALTRFDFEKLFTHGYFFRATTEAKVAEDFEGTDWLQAFVLFHRLNARSSLSYESSVNGITKPLTRAINYRLGIRYRRNFHREWLFFEIAPDMTWPVSYDGDRETVLKERRSKWLIFFRLEAHFGNASKRSYANYR
ncbi:MAG TPA: hypothetical protein ENJ64_00865 [Thiotrichales bacterium]|nr:hypothetical protein [Thiotrichales bacterium]